MSILAYLDILEQIKQTTLECGRLLSDVELVAVTKSVDWPAVLPIYLQGQRNFGENRLSDAVQKIKEAPKDCHWHFIGALQSNKIRKVIEHFSLVHSVDSLELAKKISECSRQSNRVTHVLLQANTSGEQSKQGNTPQRWKECFEEVLSLPNICVDGLMTMAPLTQDEAVIRSCFARLRHLQSDLNQMAMGKAHLRHLSMGMSNDFKIAISEGATLLRIGSALFS